MIKKKKKGDEGKEKKLLRQQSAAKQTTSVKLTIKIRSALSRVKNVFFFKSPTGQFMRKSTIYTEYIQSFFGVGGGTSTCVKEEKSSCSNIGFFPYYKCYFFFFLVLSGLDCQKPEKYWYFYSLNITPSSKKNLNCFPLHNSSCVLLIYTL